MKRYVVAIVVLVAAAAAGNMLGFYGSPADAAPKQNVPRFADSAGRSLEMIAQLKQLVNETKTQNDLLRQQLKLLQSGKLGVIVQIPRKAEKPPVVKRR
jgi:hypothetical protein